MRRGLLASAHDIAEGGLAVALAECCLAGGIGAEVELDGLLQALAIDPQEQSLLDGLPVGVAAALFGEGSGGFVVSGPRDALARLADGAGEGVRAIGSGASGEARCGSPRAFRARRAPAGELLSLTLAQLEEAHGALRELFP